MKFSLLLLVLSATLAKASNTPPPAEHEAQRQRLFSAVPDEDADQIIPSSFSSSSFPTSLGAVFTNAAEGNRRSLMDCLGVDDTPEVDPMSVPVESGMMNDNMRALQQEVIDASAGATIELLNTLAYEGELVVIDKVLTFNCIKLVGSTENCKLNGVNMYRTLLIASSVPGSPSATTVAFNNIDIVNGIAPYSTDFFNCGENCTATVGGNVVIYDSVVAFFELAIENGVVDSSLYEDTAITFSAGGNVAVFDSEVRGFLILIESTDAHI
jgi:hypothetical protein